MGSNSAKSSNDFSSEITGQMLLKFGHNDHLVMGIRIFYLKRVGPPRGAVKLSQIVL